QDLTSRSGFGPLVFHGIKSMIRCVYKAPDGSVLRITGNPYADGKYWLLATLRKKIASPPCDQCGGANACLWQNHSKFVPAVPCRGIDRPTAASQNLPEPAECPVTCQMTKSVVNLFQSIEIQQ